MMQRTQQIETHDLFMELTHLTTLRKAFYAVKRNRGAAGIDGVTVEDYEARLDEELTTLKEELTSWRYKPNPVRRVEIPKPSGGVRLLGVPCVRDRVVQTGLKLLMEPILDPTFSAHSYGFRPGRNQRGAVKQAQTLVTSGKPFIVDLDLSKFFDRINHDRLIARLGKRITDNRVLRLVGMTLRSGVLVDGVFEMNEEGVTQGSPLSPLLSNLVLDELDKELERRGLPFCRFADDCNIFAGSRKAADRIMLKISEFIETKLKLVVNREKSRVGLSHEVKFLGMTIVNGTIAISRKALSHAMNKVKELTPRGTHTRLETTMSKINNWYIGWANYYSMTQYPSQLRKIEAHIRRRLRSRLVSQQKSRRNLYNKVVKRGVKKRTAWLAVYSNRKRWALSHTRAMEMAYRNRWFTDTVGQMLYSDRGLSHWFSVDTWIRLT